MNRQRLADLMGKERFDDVGLSSAERTEMLELQALAGVRADAPIRMVRQWAAGMLDTSQRSMTPRQRQLETLAMRWPTPRLTPRQKIVELYRQRMLWDMTPQQREIERLREATWA